MSESTKSVAAVRQQDELNKIYWNLNGISSILFALSDSGSVIEKDAVAVIAHDLADVCDTMRDTLVSVS